VEQNLMKVDEVTCALLFSIFHATRVILSNQALCPLHTGPGVGVEEPPWLAIGFCIGSSLQIRTERRPNSTNPSALGLAGAQSQMNLDRHFRR